MSPTAASPGLQAARRRIDALTAPAEAMVREVERAPPSKATLVKLDAAFTDARRALVTDPELSRLGRALSAADRQAVQAYTKARYRPLEGRVRAAGLRHRKAANRALGLP